MIIDAHGHADEYEALGWIDPPELIVSLMDRAGIDMACITTYGEAPMYTDAITKLVEFVQRFPDRLIGFARIVPMGEPVLELVEYVASCPEIRGIKFHPVANNIKAYYEPCLVVMRRAAQLGLPIFTHCGDKVGCQPLQIAMGAQLCPEATIICHMGGFLHSEDAIRMAKRCPNIYLDTSSIPYPDLIKRAIDEIGPRRIVFASDAPAGDPISDLAKITNLGLNKEEEEMILFRNMAKILSLDTIRGVKI